MQVVPRTCSSLQSTIHLWIHENMRCFHDRLVDDVDRRYFTEELMMGRAATGSWPLVWVDSAGSVG